MRGFLVNLPPYPFFLSLSLFYPFFLLAEARLGLLVVVSPAVKVLVGRIGLYQGSFCPIGLATSSGRLVDKSRQSLGTLDPRLEL